MTDALYFKILQERELDVYRKICDGLSIDDLDANAIEKMKQEYANKWNKPEFVKLPTSQVLSDFKSGHKEVAFFFIVLAMPV